MLKDILNQFEVVTDSSIIYTNIYMINHQSSTNDIIERLPQLGIINKATFIRKGIYLKVDYLKNPTEWYKVPDWDEFKSKLNELRKVNGIELPHYINYEFIKNHHVFELKRKYDYSGHSDTYYVIDDLSELPKFLVGIRNVYETSYAIDRNVMFQ